MAVTLKQIADAAGVSRGTVDRVLHGRGHVNAAVEETICNLAKQMGYQPNRLGRALVMSARDIKIGIILQFAETPFMKSVLEGAQQVQQELQGMGVAVFIEVIEFYNVPRMLQSMDDMMARGVHALALTPGNAPEIIEKMKQIQQAGIDVVTFNLDVVDAPRLCYVGLDNARAGGACAGLMHLVLRAGKILPISGYEGNTAQRERMESFCHMIDAQFPSLTLLPVQLCNDADTIAEQIVTQALHEHPDLDAIYIAGSGQAGVCRALHQANRTGDVHVICYDLTQANMDALACGAIDFIIDQNAYEQGYRPAKLLYDKLVLGIQPTQEYYYTDICIKTKYNL